MAIGEAEKTRHGKNKYGGEKEKDKKHGKI
jgi:hypothetical protein